MTKYIHSFETDQQVRKLLRLGEEPCLHIDELQAHRVVMDGCVEFMDRLLGFYRSWALDEICVELPTKQVFTTPAARGDFRLMPCIVHDDRLKFVKIIGTNEEERTVKDKICVGKALLIDYYDNHVYAIFDVCALSSFRTAAISVLALQMTLPDKRHIGLIGMGRIGFYTAYILHRWLGVKHFAVTDCNTEIQGNFKDLCALYMPEVEVDVHPLALIAEQCDAVFLATTSSRPLLTAANAAHLPFIASVGADADNLSELDASLLASHQVITDSMQSICLGDMRRWQQQGDLTASRVTELRHLNQMQRDDLRRFLFISTGIAVQDALINQFVFEKVQSIHPATSPTSEEMECLRPQVYHS